MRIVVLMENNALTPQLECEHGLSLYIEACGRKILFDAGQSGAFADNARALGVDLSQVEMAFLSHGHYDHGGGMLRFFRENSHAPLYVSRHAFVPQYNGTQKYIGLDPALAGSVRLRLTDGEVRFAHGLRLMPLPDTAARYPAYGQGLNAVIDGNFVPDDFRHEQYLEITEGDKRVLISGCSHRGVLNIVTAFAPDVLIGGFHFAKLDPQGEELRGLGQALLNTGAVYYTGHCTGQEQTAVLAGVMGDALHEMHAGSEIII